MESLRSSPRTGKDLHAAGACLSLPEYRPVEVRVKRRVAVGSATRASAKVMGSFDSATLSAVVVFGLMMCGL